MNPATIDAITSELLREHGVVLPDGDAELRRALSLLPDVDASAVAEGVPWVFAISPNGTMFTVRVSKGGSVSVESRPLDADKLIVSMASKVVCQTKTQITREVSWTFRYVAEVKVPSRGKWQKITGRVYIDAQRGDERPDPREEFARAIAKRAGWPVAGDGPGVI